MKQTRREKSVYKILKPVQQRQVYTEQDKHPLSAKSTRNLFSTWILFTNSPMITYSISHPNKTSHSN